jgi:hypothetical protein
MEIDVNFDLRTDSNGKDPDGHSATLSRYHQRLWSKPLPNGKPFDLSQDTRKSVLTHHSELGEFVLSSDAILPTFVGWKRVEPIIDQIDEQVIDEFLELAYTIGARMVFPSNKVRGESTINGARGFNPLISDRFDLTLECIRRFYVGVQSPLFETLSRYSTFFDLFDNFHGYVNFFLLEDLVGDDRVKFFLPFDDFRPPAVPKDLLSYHEYRYKSVAFVCARNERINQLNL